MDLSLSLDAKEVLFHLNYMGYRNVTKEQLKFFMTDLKKLIKYEASPREIPETVTPSVRVSSSNFNRLFESHTICSKNRNIKELIKNPKINKLETKTDMALKTKAKHTLQLKDLAPKDKQPLEQKINKDPVVEKENIPTKDQHPKRPGSKMWIRPKSAQPVRKSVPKNNPVDLYNAYQKDWLKFKSNMCESSHSELRWSIREKMLGAT
ncbi:unnamed protein product [Diamesa tonsa]